MLSKAQSKLEEANAKESELKNTQREAQQLMDKAKAVC